MLTEVSEVIERLCYGPQVMDKSVIGPDFQKKEAVPPYKESQYALKRKGKVS